MSELNMSSGYTVIGEFRDDQGIVGVVSKKEKPNGFLGFSFALFKEFERKPGGPTERTGWLNDRHLGAARRMLNRIEERIDTEMDKRHAQRRHGRVASGEFTTK